MDVPDKKTGAIVSLLMAIAACAGVAVGVAWGNFNIKPPGEANDLDMDAVAAAPILPEGRAGERIEPSQADITRARLTRIKSALEEYALEQGGYPPDLETLVGVGFLGEKSLIDGWGHPFHYAQKAQGYALRSAGADGAPSDDDLR